MADMVPIGFDELVRKIAFLQR